MGQHSEYLIALVPLIPRCVTITLVMIASQDEWCPGSISLKVILTHPTSKTCKLWQTQIYLFLCKFSEIIWVDFSHLAVWWSLIPCCHLAFYKFLPSWMFEQIGWRRFNTSFIHGNGSFQISGTLQDHHVTWKGSSIPLQYKIYFNFNI